MPSCNNLRFAARTLGHRPALAVATIATLALSSGVNTAVFSVTNALLLRPLGYPEPHRLMLLEVKRKDANQEINNGFSLGRYELVRDHNRSFAGVAAGTNDSLNMSGHGEPLQVPIARVSPNFFAVLGVNPQRGTACFRKTKDNLVAPAWSSLAMRCGARVSEAIPGSSARS